MSTLLNIHSWLDQVPTRQWLDEQRHLAEIGAAMPELIVGSAPLAEVHRLDLSLFVVFEEAALRVSGSLVRSAPTLAAMNLAAEQTLDEARHHELFLTRLAHACAAAGVTEPAVSEELMAPPLVRFLERTYEVVDRGQFIEGLVLMNLIFEGMAYPLYDYERRYWQPLDPYLAGMVEAVFADETRHVGHGANLVCDLLAGDPTRRAQVSALCRDMTALMGEVFEFYVRNFVTLFDGVAQLHKDAFAGAELAPGKLICETPYEEQIAAIHQSIKKVHGRILARAGLS